VHPLVGIVNKSSRLPPPHGYPEGIHDEFRAHVGVHRPPNDLLALVGVQDEGQMLQTFPRRYVMSATQTLSTSVATKFLSRKSSAADLLPRPVVAPLLPRMQARGPALRMSLATRLRPQRTPERSELRMHPRRTLALTVALVDF
jgi:hypothetical protein